MKRNIKNVAYLCLLSCMFSCSSDDFKKHGSGLEYKFVIHNDDSVETKTGDILVLNMRYTNNNDSILFDSREISGSFRMRLGPPSHNGGCIEDGFSMMHLGDSALFLIDARLFYQETRKMQIPSGVDPNSKLKFYVRLKKILTIKELEEEKKAERLYNEKAETRILKNYLKRANITAEPSLSGLYYIEEEEGKGESPKTGQTVAIHYRGTFINGELFDSSYKRNEPWRFRLGIRQAVPGMEEGVAKMKVGGKAQLILPSHLAYGETGNGNIIPPFSTLIFYVELVSVE